MKKVLFVLLVMSIFLCSLRAQTILSRDNIQTKQVILLRENCESQQFSVCSDRFEQSYRVHPHYIFFDSISIFSSYDNGVLDFIFPSHRDLLRTHGISSNVDWRSDSLFKQLKSKQNSVVYYNRALKRKVRRYNRKNKIKSMFNGELVFHSYVANISYIYGGKKEITLPDLNNESKFKLISVKEVDIFYILDILYVEPIELKL